MIEYSPIASLPSPFDHEMAQLELGLRHVIKREFCSADELEDARRRGWQVVVAAGEYTFAHRSADITHAGGSHYTAFIGEKRALEQARELELLERRGSGEERREAVRELGRLLGYPPCCTAAYLSQSEQSESASFARLFAEGPHRSACAGNNLFVLSHSLISHFPCSMACPFSAEIARAGWHAMASTSPECAEALLALISAPIQVWDRYRFLITHPSAGLVAPQNIERASRLLSHPLLVEFIAKIDAGDPPVGGVHFAFTQMW